MFCMSVCARACMRSRACVCARVRVCVCVCMRVRVRARTDQRNVYINGLHPLRLPIDIFSLLQLLLHVNCISRSVLYKCIEHCL